MGILNVTIQFKDGCRKVYKALFLEASAKRFLRLRLYSGETEHIRLDTVSTMTMLPAGNETSENVESYDAG